ncbi:MAG: hydrogen peroxide-inducible genes activator [Niabella sp.]
MNLQQIYYILAVSETGSYTLAAEKCFVTQSTLSTMIARFEGEMKIQIFDRKTKPVSLTNEGISIITQLKLIAKEVTALGDLVQTLKGEMSGSLKIGIIPTVAPYILPEFLNGFVQQFPQMTFTVSEMPTGHIVEQLQKRELDIGVLAGPVEADTLDEIPLYNEPFVLYDGTKGKQKKYRSLDEIEMEKFWLLEEGHCFRTQVSRICDLDNCKHNSSLNFDFKAGSIDSLIRFVKTNNGITLLPYLATLDFLPEEIAKISLLPQPVPVRSISLLVHKHFVKTDILTLLQKEIQQKILPLLKTKKREEVVVPV